MSECCSLNNVYNTGCQEGSAAVVMVSRSRLLVGRLQSSWAQAAEFERSLLEISSRQRLMCQELPYLILVGECLNNCTLLFRSLVVVAMDNQES
jgi:hypothetical protein